jgi:hypothetical protein
VKFRRCVAGNQLGRFAIHVVGWRAGKGSLKKAAASNSRLRAANVVLAKTKGVEARVMRRRQKVK